MHCRSTCVSSARAMSLECWSTFTLSRERVLSERIVSRTCTAEALSATRPMQLPKHCGSRACIVRAPFETVRAHFCKIKNGAFSMGRAFLSKK
ncbi:hypothetical protein AMTRI_Chr12g239080 [Amborella trichopoda]